MSLLYLLTNVRVWYMFSPYYFKTVILNSISQIGNLSSYVISDAKPQQLTSVCHTLCQFRALARIGKVTVKENIDKGNTEQDLVLPRNH